jgi:hypothetical protein
MQAGVSLMLLKRVIYGAKKSTEEWEIPFVYLQNILYAWIAKRKRFASNNR